LQFVKQEQAEKKALAILAVKTSKEFWGKQLSPKGRLKIDAADVALVSIGKGIFNIIKEDGLYFVETPILRKKKLIVRFLYGLFPRLCQT